MLKELEVVSNVIGNEYNYWNGPSNLRWNVLKIHTALSLTFTLHWLVSFYLRHVTDKVIQPYLGRGYIITWDKQEGHCSQYRGHVWKNVGGFKKVLDFVYYLTVIYIVDRSSWFLSFGPLSLHLKCGVGASQLLPWFYQYGHAMSSVAFQLSLSF